MIKPLGSKVVIKRDIKNNESATAGGIILVSDGKQDIPVGTVVVTGPGRYAENGTRIEPSVSAGDRVLFEKFAGSPISVDGKDYIMMDESEILAIL